MPGQSQEPVGGAIDAAAGGWYLKLGDGGCWLAADDGGRDHYWLARDSALLIRGGANYAYEQSNAELTAWAATHYATAEVEVSVIGLRVESERQVILRQDPERHAIDLLHHLRRFLPHHAVRRLGLCPLTLSLGVRRVGPRLQLRRPGGASEHDEGSASRRAKRARRAAP